MKFLTEKLSTFLFVQIWKLYNNPKMDLNVSFYVDVSKALHVSSL